MRHLRPISYLASLVLWAGLFFCAACPKEASAQSPVIGPTLVHLLSYHSTASADVTLTQGDTAPVMDALLESATGAGVNLTGANVALVADSAGGTTDAINAPCTIINAKSGEVKYAWQTTDTATAGSYTLVFIVTQSDGTQVTFPSDHSLRLAVTAGTHYTMSGSSPPGGTGGTTPISYTSSYVATDGAIGTNAAWEAGKSAVWYPELQRKGTDYIEAGIAQENPALINQGLQILDWGVGKEASDGSFPGAGAVPITATNANAATGAVFHTTSLFFEGLARACIDLQNYHPVTYSLPAGTYTAKIAGYSAKLEATAQWLTNPAWTPPGASSAVNVQALGFTYDSVFSHRYMLLAAGLQECANVTGDSSLVTKTGGVNWWWDQWPGRQLPTGWTGAIPQTTLDGGNSPAILVAPGGTAPTGTGLSISAVGVLPETNGYDVSYHMVDVMHACHWYEASSDATRKSQLPGIITYALQWERSRESTAGVIDPTGSSRIGIEQNIDGTSIKGLDNSSIITAFALGGVIDGKGRDVLGGLRFSYVGLTPDSGDAIDANGAIGSNSTYDSGTATTYNIGTQRDCADWIAQGIKLENDSQIMQGLTILQWGLAQQAADGSFPNTSSRYTDACTFIEAASRTLLMLEAYSPISHTAPSTLTANLTADIAQIDKSVQYLTSPAMVASGYVSKTSASKIMTYAAALGEAGALVASSFPADASAAIAQSGTFLTTALAMQTSDGTFTENGLYDPNAQAGTMAQLEHLYIYGTAGTSTKTQMSSDLSAALVKEESQINGDGSFRYNSPAKTAIIGDFAAGQTITGTAAFGVISARIAGYGQGV